MNLLAFDTATPATAVGAQRSGQDPVEARHDPAPDERPALATGPETPLAVGGGAVRFQAQLRAAGAAVPAADSPLHRPDGRHLCRLAAAAETADRDAVLPQYVRAPDATPHPR